MNIDGVGAFDHVSRARMFTELLHNSELQCLVPFIRQWYGEQSEFRWVDEHGTCHTILQGDGGEQGDAMMPALFCLALHPALAEIRRRLPPGAEILAYLDDIYVACDPTDAHFILHDVQQTFREMCRIDVHTGKLVIWGRTPQPCPQDIAPVAPTAWKCDAPLHERGIKILGTPLGAPQFVRSFGAKLADRRAKLLQLLPKLPTLQSAWLLLYYCAVPRLNHLLRTLPPTEVQ